MTSRNAEPESVVVAVDGSEEGYAPVPFAAREAAAHGLELRIVHVMPLRVPVLPLVLGTEHGLGAFASETLASATRLALDTAPGLVVTRHAPMGNRVEEVVDAAAHARCLVVGRRASGVLDHACTGGTLDGIASRASCPVFVVPLPEYGKDQPLRVVAAYKSESHSAELFDSAFRDADELGASVEVVHAWKLPGMYDDVIAGRVQDDAWSRQQTAAIREYLEPWHDSYPQLQVTIRVVHASPARALVEASEGAERLVLVRPLHGSLVHHLGRTARGALRFSRCPIHVVPARRADELTMAPIAAEQAGALLR